LKKFLILLLIFIAVSFAVYGDDDTSGGNVVAPDVFYFFYSYKCPHCKEAHPFVEKLKSEYPGIIFKELEVMKVPENRELFKKMIGDLGIQGGGVPTFIFKGKFVVGFQQGHHDRLVREMIDMNASSHSKESCTSSECKECKENIIDVPVLGKIDAKLVSLPGFTFIIGLLDGVNPCAMWVLMFLLTLLVNAKSRKKLVLVGSVFVISSGVVYFLFMTAWLNMFTFMGVAAYITVILGIIALLMGLINVKEFFFFKQGVSLMIPEKAKPKLYEKMRKVINNSNFLISLLGTVALAFFVNLIELGCTIGLPAIYTRVLSVQKIDISTKYLYMALYNAYYVIPLAAIVILFVLTMGKYRFQEKHAKILKLVSGSLMIVLGVILILKPELLVFS